MKHFFLSVLLLATYSVYAQPAIQWQKAFGGSKAEIFGCVKQTADGGYIMTGTTQSADGDVTRNQGGQDIWVVKLAASGAIAWQKTYGGTSSDQGQYIEQTSDGGYILIGNTVSIDGDVTGKHGGVGGEDVWVLKLTDTGGITWKKAYGGASADRGLMIHQTSDGGYIFVGNTASSDGDVTHNHGMTDMWVVKLTPAGIITWQKTYGGSGSEGGTSIEQTRDGGYIVGGYASTISGDITSSYGLGDEWVLKLNDTGSITWQKSYGGSKPESITMIHQTADSGYISIGATTSTDHDVAGLHGTASDMWVVKMNAAGAITWAKTYGGTQDDFGLSLIETSNGYVIAGNTSSTDGDVTGLHGSGFDMWLASLTRSGTIKWQKTIGGTSTEQQTVITGTKDGGYITGGLSSSTDGDAAGSGNHGNGDLWIVKMGPALEVSQVGNMMTSIRVYPIPTSGLINVSLPEGYEDVTITIMNTTGQIIPLKSDDKGLNRVLKLNGISAGLYLLEVVSKDAVSTYRIVYQP